MSVRKTVYKLNKRTLPLLVIGIGLAVGNQLSGINVIQYFGPTLLKSVTGSNSNALLVTFLLSISQFVGVVIGMMLLDRVGRRKLLLLGALASVRFFSLLFLCLLFAVHRYCGGGRAIRFYALFWDYLGTNRVDRSRRNFPY